MNKELEEYQSAVNKLSNLDIPRIELMERYCDSIDNISSVNDLFKMNNHVYLAKSFKFLQI